MDFNSAWQAKLKSYLPTYYKQRADDLKNLKEALETGNFSKIMAIGHKIKGNAATYGFPELGELGAALEKNAAAKDMALVTEKIAKIEEWLKAVTQHQ